jgi:hypothetical protein
VTSDKRRVTSDKRRVTSDKRRVTAILWLFHNLASGGLSDILGQYTVSKQEWKH